jgi:hypothetical protein
MRNKSEPKFLNLVGAQKLIPSLAESIPGLLKYLQLQPQKKTGFHLRVMIDIEGLLS